MDDSNVLLAQTCSTPNFGWLDCSVWWYTPNLILESQLADGKIQVLLLDAIPYHQVIGSNNLDPVSSVPCMSVIKTGFCVLKLTRCSGTSTICYMFFSTLYLNHQVDIPVWSHLWPFRFSQAPHFFRLQGFQGPATALSKTMAKTKMISTITLAVQVWHSGIGRLLFTYSLIHSRPSELGDCTRNQKMMLHRVYAPYILYYNIHILYI